MPGPNTNMRVCTECGTICGEVNAQADTCCICDNLQLEDYCDICAMRSKTSGCCDPAGG